MERYKAGIAHIIYWHGNDLLMAYCELFIFDFVVCLFQVGVVVYGYRPKIWFLLNRHSRFDTLLQEIQSTPFDESPGNNIGLFFSHSFLINILTGVVPY